MARASNEPQQLLVGGKDDLYVFANLCDQHHMFANFRIEIPGADGGIDELIRDLPTRLQQRTLRTLGVVVDADHDPISRWHRPRGALDSTAASLPPAPASGGWIVDTIGPVGQLRLGIWIMPDNTRPGILEDFVITLIPEIDPLLPHARAALTSIESANIHRYPIAHRPKALIHSWLAWQETPGNPMGTAIKAGYLRHDAPTALAFVAWLRRLFDPTSLTQAV